MRRWLPTALACTALLPAPVARAELPAWLRTDNGHVTRGNEKLGKGDAKGALEDYTAAAAELPAEPGVALNRGIALLKLGELGKAREALQRATSPSAPATLRADGYQDLALAFYREADALAGQGKHEEAQKLFREAVDAAKRALRLRPGDANAAWNLELAQRRVREQEQKQKEQEQEQKEQEQKNDGQGDQGQQPKPDQKKAQPQPPEQPSDPPEEPQPMPADKPVPADVKQALDALEDGEENFERVRARQQGARERRAPEKDW